MEPAAVASEARVAEGKDARLRAGPTRTPALAARRSLLGHAVAQLDIGLGTPSAVDYFARVLALVAQARTRPITSSGRTAVAWTVVSK